MVKSKHSILIRQDAASYAYPVLFAQYTSLSALLEQTTKGRVRVLLTNNHLHNLYRDTITAFLQEPDTFSIVVPDGEQYKTLSYYTKVMDELMALGVGRDAVLIAFGGGVIGDLAGFVAATYMRGIAYIQVPTSLLAMVDSSVGAKTAVNHAQGKNLIGAFYPPEMVVIATAFLVTLDRRTLASGMAEVIKYGLLSGEPMLQEIEAFIASDPIAKLYEQTNLGQWEGLIAACVQVKQHYVEADPREQGIRAHLNLGHTFGHALEYLGHFQAWQHGEAVAWGLYMMACLSARYYNLDNGLAERIKRMLAALNLPYDVPEAFTPERIIAAMALDKKKKQQRLRFVLCREPGVIELVSDIQEGMIHEILHKNAARRCGS